jgi:hypothetical protein
MNENNQAQEEEENSKIQLEKLLKTLDSQVETK